MIRMARYSSTPRKASMSSFIRAFTSPGDASCSNFSEDVPVVLVVDARNLRLLRSDHAPAEPAAQPDRPVPTHHGAPCGDRGGGEQAG